MDFAVRSVGEAGLKTRLYTVRIMATIMTPPRF